MPSLNPTSRLLVVSHRRPRGMPHPSTSDNQMLVCWCRPPLIPTEQTLHNYKQCQTHSYPVVSASHGHGERPSLSDSEETDSVCAQILPSSPNALRPWPRVWQHERAGEVGLTWQEVLIYGHFEIKQGEALMLKVTAEEGTEFSGNRIRTSGCLSQRK